MHACFIISLLSLVLVMRHIPEAVDQSIVLQIDLRCAAHRREQLAQVAADVRYGGCLQGPRISVGTYIIKI